MITGLVFHQVALFAARACPPVQAATNFVPKTAAVLPRWFGLSRIGELHGILMAATVADSAVGPAILAVSHDLTQSYQPALWALTGVTIAVAATAAATPPPNSSVT